MADTSSHQARREALGDAIDGLERFYEAHGCSTMAERSKLYDVVQGLQRLCLLSGYSDMADACEELQRRAGL